MWSRDWLSEVTYTVSSGTLNFTPLFRCSLACSVCLNNEFVILAEYCLSVNIDFMVSARHSEGPPFRRAAIPKSPPFRKPLFRVCGEIVLDIVSYYV